MLGTVYTPLIYTQVHGILRVSCFSSGTLNEQRLKLKVPFWLCHLRERLVEAAKPSFLLHQKSPEAKTTIRTLTKFTSVKMSSIEI
jgi:hypothetical protein